MNDDPTITPRRSTAVNERGQAIAAPAEGFGEEAFGQAEDTTLRWLGMAGFLLNARGTTIMLDPVLRDFDMPLLIEPPIAAEAVPHLDAVLVTHADNDHFSVPTCEALRGVTDAFHSTRYVSSLMQTEGLPASGHDIGAEFEVGPVRVLLTPADHAWQNANPEPGQRVFRDEDCCGFWIATPDGTIWAPGDSRLIPDHHLTMPSPDVLIFDFSDSEWHFGFENAIRMADAYPDALLFLHHWGSVDAPDFSPFNGDPDEVYEAVTHPERVRVLAPGAPLVLSSRKD